MNEVEYKVARRLWSQGWKLIFKGWPDFLCVRRNSISDSWEVKAVEVKGPGDSLSLDQQQIRAALVLAGLTVDVCRVRFVDGSWVADEHSEAERITPLLARSILAKLKEEPARVHYRQRPQRKQQNFTIAPEGKACASPDCRITFFPRRMLQKFCSTKCRIRESVRAVRERQKVTAS